MNTQLSHISGRRFAPRAAVACGLCLGACSSFGQEALNEGQEVEQGRRARKQAIDRNLYNLKAGPVLMRFGALMGVEFNDNPNLVEEGRKGDLIFHPEVSVNTLWALNPRNALAFDLGVGYRKYINNTELDHLIIAPSSELSFDISTGDVTINLHDRISHTQNPANDPTVSGTGDFGGIENTAGLRVDWDLNQLLLSAGYDHYNFFSTTDGVAQNVERRTGATMVDDGVQDRSSDLFYGRAGFRVSPAITTGLEAGGGFTEYDSEFYNDNTQFTVGPFVEAQLTRDISGRLAGGYLHSTFDDADFSSAPDSVDDFYAEISVQQQLSQYMSHRLALGREARSGVESELVTMWYARYQNDWALSRVMNLGSSLFYENGRERSNVSEKFWRVGASFGVSVPLTRQLTAGANYAVLHKNSDQENRDYLQNVVSLEFRYVF
jgi:hypothetical protein